MNRLFDRIAVLLMCLLFSSGVAKAQAPLWDLNDVTQVYGLETSVSSGVRLSEVLPREVYAQVVGTMGLTPGARTPGLILTPEELYRNLSIVAFRVDPCFRDRFTDPCRRQIRVVWQPITFAGASYTTVDAALHTFYDLTAEQFDLVLQNLQAFKQAAKARTDGAPLQVHPGLRDKNSSYAQSVGTLLRRAIGWRNTSRIAVMKLVMGENGWRFSSFDVVNGKLQLMQIFPGLIQEQQIANLAEDGAYDSRGTMLSLVPREKPDQLFRVVNDSHDPSLADLETLKTYFARSIRISQPHLHLPGTIDCLSCHASDGVKAVTARTLIARGFAVKIPLPTGRHNFRNMSALYGSTRSQRGLGYFRDGFQVLDRTILESAAIADQLNSAKAGLRKR